MSTHFKEKNYLLLIMSCLVVAQHTAAAVYRPTSAAGLITAIGLANTTLDDDVIDLQGNVFAYTSHCTNATYCTGYVAGQSALPPILAMTTAGELAVINGGIIRTPTASDTFRFFEIQAGANLMLFNVTLENGYAITPVSSEAEHDGSPHVLVGVDDDGGAIYNAGVLDVVNCDITNNTANDSGGGIYNIGVLDIQSSTITNNTALDASGSPGPSYGGGGGIYNGVGAIICSIDNSTIAGNSTLGFGAGINNQGSANNIFDTTIAYNFCCTPVENGICNEQPTTSGGGIYNDGNAVVLQVVNSTIANNLAFQGGGIYNNSSSVPAVTIKDNIPLVMAGSYIYNSTISANTASAGGGGIYNNNNSNVGDADAVIEGLFSNIVAGNTDTNEISIAAPDIENLGTIASEGNNLIGNNQGVSAIENGVNNDIVGSPSNPINPMLKPLDNNGGFTSTMALLPNSLGINNGLNPYSLFYDQRGAGFDRTKCGLTDIGAFEYQKCFLDSDGDTEAIADR